MRRAIAFANDYIAKKRLPMVSEVTMLVQEAGNSPRKRVLRPHNDGVQKKPASNEEVNESAKKLKVVIPAPREEAESRRTWD